VSVSTNLNKELMKKARLYKLSKLSGQLKTMTTDASEYIAEVCLVAPSGGRMAWRQSSAVCIFLTRFTITEPSSGWIYVKLFMSPRIWLVNWTNKHATYNVAERLSPERCEASGRALSNSNHTAPQAPSPSATVAYDSTECCN